MSPEQLLEKVASIQVDENGCKRWPMNIDTCGYGRVTLFGRRTKAHRAVYQLLNGDLDRWTFVCHRCDVPDCVNPDHLFAGTHVDNMNDMKKKGRGRTSTRVGEMNSCARLTADKVRAIKKEIKAGRLGYEIAAEFGIAPGHVSRIKLGKRWPHIQD